MPQFNATSMYNPNPEYRIQKEGNKYRLFFLEPTNIIDMGWGARADGGKVTDLGLKTNDQLFKETGMDSQNIYPMLPGGVESYKQKATPDQQTIQEQIAQTFSNFDPSNKTGWQQQLGQLTAQAQQKLKENPNLKDKTYGAVWNEFRYSPQNAQAIGQVQGQGAGQTSSAPSGANGLTPAQQQTLDVLQDKLTKDIINPDVEISQGEIAKYLGQAKQELDPYYKQLFSQAEQDLTTGLRQLGEDVTSREGELERQYGKGLQNIQEQAAQRGLTFSTIRSGQEKDLVSSTQAAIEQGRREAERRALQLGTTAEREIGSKQFPMQTPGLQTTPGVQYGSPGVMGFLKSQEKRPLYTPGKNTVGTLEQQQLAATESRKRELIGGEREFRGLQTI